MGVIGCYRHNFEAPGPLSTSLSTLLAGTWTRSTLSRQDEHSMLGTSAILEIAGSCPLPPVIDEGFPNARRCQLDTVRFSGYTGDPPDVILIRPASFT